MINDYVIIKENNGDENIYVIWLSDNKKKALDGLYAHEE